MAELRNSIPTECPMIRHSRITSNHRRVVPRLVNGLPCDRQRRVGVNSTKAPARSGSFFVLLHELETGARLADPRFQALIGRVLAAALQRHLDPSRSTEFGRCRESEWRQTSLPQSAFDEFKRESKIPRRPLESVRLRRGGWSEPIPSMHECTQRCRTSGMQKSATVNHGPSKRSALGLGRSEECG